MKIYRANDNRIEMWRFQDWINSQSDSLFGKKIGISWKVGKKRKLRSYRLTWDIWECDCCGPITSITFSKGGKEFRMDNHFGTGWMDMKAL